MPTLHPSPQRTSRCISRDPTGRLEAPSPKRTCTGKWPLCSGPRPTWTPACRPPCAFPCSCAGPRTGSSASPWSSSTCRTQVPSDRDFMASSSPVSCTNCSPQVGSGSRHISVWPDFLQGPGKVGSRQRLLSWRASKCTQAIWSDVCCHLGSLWSLEHSLGLGEALRHLTLACPCRKILKSVRRAGVGFCLTRGQPGLHSHFLYGPPSLPGINSEHSQELVTPECLWL